MKNIGVVLGLFLMTSLFVSGVFAADTPGKKKNEAGPYRGVVAELDLKANRMVVAQNDSELAMVFNILDAKTGKGYRDVGEVKPGDQVVVSFEARVGTIYATIIAKGTAPAKKEASSPQKKEKPKNHP